MPHLVRDLETPLIQVVEKTEDLPRLLDSLKSIFATRVPAVNRALIRHLDIRHSQYGYIGLKDYTLYPLIRPGSFVQVDQNVRKIQPRKWRTEYDRPIYFVELRDGYACSWCELQEGRLFLIPHPLSPCSVQIGRAHSDAEIVGQVTAVAMRITDGSPAGSDVSGELPSRV